MVSQTKFHLYIKEKKVSLTPLSPSEVFEDQIKMRVKRDQERKEEENKTDKKREKHEMREKKNKSGDKKKSHIVKKIKIKRRDKYRACS